MTDENFEGLTEGIKRYVIDQVGKVLLLCEKVDERVGTVEHKIEAFDKRSYHLEGRMEEVKEQIGEVKDQGKLYHEEVMGEIKGVVETFKPLGFLSEHASEFQAMIVGYKKSRSTWGFVGKTALGVAVAAIVTGFFAVIVAGLIAKVQAPVEHTVYTQRTESYERKPDDDRRDHTDQTTRQ